MTETQQWITLLVVSVGLVFTRFIIFWIFPPSKQPPTSVEYLGKVLPAAAIALILVYSLRDVQLTAFPFGIPEAISILIVILVQKWRRSTLLSVIGGTGVYMFLIQFVF